MYAGEILNMFILEFIGIIPDHFNLPAVFLLFYPSKLENGYLILFFFQCNDMNPIVSEIICINTGRCRFKNIAQFCRLKNQQHGKLIYKNRIFGTLYL